MDHLTTQPPSPPFQTITNKGKFWRKREREDYLNVLFNVCHLPLQKITHIYKSDFETFLIDSNSTYNLLKYQKKKKNKINEI